MNAPTQITDAAKFGYKHPLYVIWGNMKQRCRNPKNTNFKHYGARGIKICERWNVFKNFAMDMGDRPEGATIERINNDGDYSPDNCRWASRPEQSNNRRPCIFVSVNGESKNLTQLAKEIGGNRSLIHGRMARGWTLEEAISTPMNKNISEDRKSWHSKRKNL